MSTLNVNSIQTAGGASPVLTADIAKKSELAASEGAGSVGYTPAGLGAMSSTVEAKLQDYVSVLDFFADGVSGVRVDPTGVVASHLGIQKALDTGKSVFLPTGNYKLSAPVTLSTVGQRLYGESAHSTYLTGGLDHDLVRIAASHCEVDHIHFRPSNYSDASPPVFAPIRAYAALAHIHDNRFLAAAAGHGTAILLDDVNPATSTVVAGAYIHTIANNRIGASGYDFKYAIFCLSATNGQQATKFQNNQILGDTGIYVYRGGGNYYLGNLFQSSTGDYTTGVGNAIDLQVDVVGETITGNYIERYNFGVISRRVASDYVVASVFGNHWDNNNTNYYSLGSVFYRYIDDEIMAVTTNGWQENFSSPDNFKLINKDGVEIYNINRANTSFEPKMLAHNLVQSLSFVANATTVTPAASWCNITGAGAHRTGCFLGNGVRDGQHLYLFGLTWSVEILNNPAATQNIHFAANAASATFGQSGSVGTMHLIWSATSNMWLEISRTMA